MCNIISEEFKNIKNLKDIPDDYFVPGRKVKVIGNEKYVKKVQQHRFGWNDSMKQCLNRVYEVKCIDADKGIKLLTSKEWIFDRASLESIGDVASESENPLVPATVTTKLDACIPPEPEKNEFKIGDTVRLDSNEERFIELQSKFGGYSRHYMQPILGKMAKIKHISALGILVKCGEDFTVNPELLHKVASESENPSCQATVATKPDACIPPEPVTLESENQSLPATVTTKPDACIPPEPVKSESENPLLPETVTTKPDACIPPDPDGLKRFFEAIKKGDIKYVSKFIKIEWLTMKGPHGRTPINWACCYGQKDIVEFLIGFGDKMNIFDDKGKLPVHNCLLFNHPHVLELILGKNTNAIQALTADGKTLLDLAVIGNQQDMIKLLTEANINKSIMIECGICFDRAKNTYFKDCGHTACNVCADQLIVCHLCKKPILQRQSFKS